ncbi:hypothetical protein [Aestuariivirga sp.]|uniref:capsular polysaccharide export protein, LipB/KpsS family n=1 Tax=Aestuariivirga sp. TaxID=2650926 RepID=UPI0039E50AE6
MRAVSAAAGGYSQDVPAERHFLLLQGPCGGFFRHLQRELMAKGHQATRVVLNGGDLVDSIFARALLYRRAFADWPEWIAAAARQRQVTDLVLYGDCRPYHRVAISVLKPLGIRIHVLEEGYLRPNWITYEQNGVNGNSSIAGLDLDALSAPELDHIPTQPELQLRGTLGRYAFSGILYYLYCLLLTPVFPRYLSHRELDIAGEATLWLGRLFSWPYRRRQTERAMREIDLLGKPVHLVLLQLNGDSQIREHSRFASVRGFVEFCLAEFAASETRDAILVFKNHPLDNGVINLARLIREESARLNLEGRVFFVETGKLVPLLEKSVSATAVNSTACHQALRRGIPTMVLGKAVFNHPQIVPRMRLAAFFRARPQKDIRYYDRLVNLLRLTCQVNGGFYSRQGRVALLPDLVQRMVAPPLLPQDYITLAEDKAKAS